MFIGIGINLVKSGASSSPASLFSAGEQGAWFDPSDLTTLFQDTAGTVPVTTVGQSVALVLDKSGRKNNATQSLPSQRPLYGRTPSSGVRNIANGSASSTITTYWPASTTTNGVTATKIATGIDTDGLPYVDVRYQGLPTGTFHDLVFTYSPTYVGVGNPFTGSVILRVIAGTASNTAGLTVRIQEYTAADVFISNSPPSRVTSSTDTISISTNNIATGPKARVILDLSLSVGLAVDITYRIKGLQFEKGNARTNYQFNYSQYNVVESPFSSLGCLFFDGVDDNMVTSAVDLSNTRAVTMWCGLRKPSDAAIGNVVSLGASTSNTARFRAPSGALNNFNFTAGGSALQGTDFFIAAPATAVLVGEANMQSNILQMRYNGTQGVNNSVSQGTGNFQNAPIYVASRDANSIYFNGNLYSLIVRGAESTTGQITSTETWVNGKTGAY
jgi:hypothetical protein